MAMTALDKHSQNNILFDPTKVGSIPPKHLADCDEIFHWAGLPFDTNTPLEDYIKSMSL